MEVKLFLGTTTRLTNVLADEEHTARSQIAMTARLTRPGEHSMRLYLDTVFVGRASTHPDADHAYNEWCAVLNGGRDGFALDSLLALSGQMGEIEAIHHGRSRTRFDSIVTWSEVGSRAISLTMPHLVNLLTVELSRGRGLDIDGLAEDYEVCWYEREVFERFSSEDSDRWPAGQEGVRADPDITARFYQIICSAERAAAGMAEESFDPLAVDPYTGEAKSCLHTWPPPPVPSVPRSPITDVCVAAWPRQVDVFSEADNCANLLSAALWGRLIASTGQGSIGCPVLDEQEYHLPESNLLDNSQMQITVGGENQDPQDEEDAWR